MKQRGVTLLGVISTLVVFGIVASTLFVHSSTKLAAKREMSVKSDLIGIEKAISFYRYHNRALPQDLTALVERPADAKNWKGPYLESISDPWGNNYQYSAPGSGSKDYDLWSWGSDGVAGGVGGAADIGVN